jgi:mannosylglucosylglycerate synthase
LANIAMEKITLLHYTCPPVIGGVEQVLARQAELLAGDGKEVSVLTGRGEAWDARIAVRVVPGFDSRQARVLQLKQALDQGVIPSDFEAAVADNLRVLRQELVGTNWVIAHNVASLHKNLALTAALQRFAAENPQVGLVLWHHDFAWNSQRYAGELHPGYPWDLLRTAWPGAKQVTISEARRNEMCQLYRLPDEQIQVIPNGIEPAEFHHLQPETRRLSTRLGLDSATPLLLTPVRITRRKNLELGLQIVSELRRHMPGARWVITGPLGAHNPDNLVYFNELTALRSRLGLESSVSFLAESRPEGLSDAQIADFYRLADALLIPSQEEGFGLPIIEGALARLIIFCSDLPPLQALAGEWAGYFQLDEPPAEIAARIAQRLNNDPVYRLREHIRGHFTWAAIYQQKIAPLFQT